MLVSMAKMALPVSFLLDVTILVIVGSPILIVKYLATPTVLGFFCSDESIRHPYYDSTISTAVNMTVSYGLNIILILVNCVAGGLQKPGGSLKEAAMNMWKELRIFLLGVFAAQMVTGVIKQYAGRLRPHFIEVCSPSPELTEDMCGSFISPIYVTNYTCPGNADRFDNDLEEMKKRVREGRLSFPSGHASLACFGAVFAILYIQLRFVRQLAHLPRALLQLLPFLYAFFCCVSRVTDNKHHVTDVLAGACLGTLFAIAAITTSADKRASVRKRDSRIRSVPQSAVRLSQVDLRDP